MSSISRPSDLSRPNRRNGARSRLINAGKLIYGGFSPTIVDCYVFDVSASGALVETSVMVQVPAIFTLESNGSKRTVRKAWAKGNQIGLEFMD